MKVGIIGGGAIGLLAAAYLSESFEITLYARTEAQASDISCHGILLQKGLGERKYFISASPVMDWNGEEQLTIITVKQYQLASIIERIHNFSEGQKGFLFLQNGMGHLQQLETIKGHNLFVGTVEHGAVRVDAHTVRHNGVGIINTAVFSGENQTLIQFVKNAPQGFPIKMQPDYYPMLLKKLIVNAVINPLTAVLGVKNGALFSNSFYLHAVEKLFEEISNILMLKQPESYFQLVRQVCRNTAENRSSMLKDVEAGRETEVDAILGFLLDEANRQKKKAPIIEYLYLLVKGRTEKDECQS